MLDWQLGKYFNQPEPEIKLFINGPVGLNLIEGIPGLKFRRVMDFYGVNQEGAKAAIFYHSMN